MIYITMTGEFIKNFKTFGKKIYSITCVRRSCGDCFYENEFTIVYKEMWYIKLFRYLKKKLVEKWKNE